MKEEEKSCKTCKYSADGNVSISSKCIRCDSHYSKYEEKEQDKAVKV